MAAFPGGPEALTTAWLSSVLGAEVVGVTSTPVGQGRGLAGVLVRLELTYAGPQPLTAPDSLVAKFATGYEPMRLGARYMRIYEREVRFYQEFATEAGIRVPASYYGDVDAAGDAFVLLLEDLSAATPGDDLANLAPDLVAAIAEQLASMHARWWGAPRLSAPWLPSFDASGAVWQQLFDGIWPEVRDDGTLVPPDARSAGDRVVGQIAALRARLSSLPTLLHGDVRPDNLMLYGASASDPMVLIDWQNVTGGNAAYDLAYLLLTALTPEERRVHEEPLLRSYHRALRAGGVTGYDLDRCREDYRLAMIEPFARMLFLLARGHADAAEERQPRVLAQIVQRSAAALLDLDSVALLPAT